jgi:hypothetical protein
MRGPGEADTDCDIHAPLLQHFELHCNEIFISVLLIFNKILEDAKVLLNMVEVRRVQ